LRGLHKPIFRLHRKHCGDICIVVNCEKARFKGEELKNKNFKYHTGKPGGLKTKYYKDLIQDRPESLFYYGIYKNIPKNKIRSRLMENLQVYKGPVVPYDFLPNVI
jgi:large subunit ribosomal protein L13